MPTRRVESLWQAAEEHWMARHEQYARNFAGFGPELTKVIEFQLTHHIMNYYAESEILRLFVGVMQRG